MTEKELERAEILKSLEPLFTEAERTGKWFYSKYQAMWFTPAELRVAHNNNKFVWGAANWELRDPMERSAELKQHIANLVDEFGEFSQRVGPKLSTRTRYAITHLNSDGQRVLTFPNRADNFYDSMTEASLAILEFQASDGFRRAYETHVLQSLEVRPVDYYDNGDAKGIYFPI